ncbi:hypothetical protein Tco_0934509 [Tanacetum coccineum]
MTRGMTVMGQTGRAVVVTTVTTIATITPVTTTGTLVLDATIGTGVSSLTELPTMVSQQIQGTIRRGYTYPVCTTFGRRHPGECASVLQLLVLSAVQAGADPISNARLIAWLVCVERVVGSVAELLERGFIASVSHGGVHQFCSSRNKGLGAKHFSKIDFKIPGIIAGIKSREMRLFVGSGTSWNRLKKERMVKYWEIIQSLDKQTEFHVDGDGILWQGTKLCVPEDPTLREVLMTEAHSSPFSIHRVDEKI